MTCSEKIVWSDERQKWLCYDDATIDQVMNSDSFSVPSYDYSDLETKFDKNFTHTKQVISHFPLANEGQAHLDLRARMIKDVQDNLKRALQIFKLSLEEKMAGLAKSTGPIDIATPIIGAILESNWAFANIQSDQKIDYSDLTLMLDDSQSIKKGCCVKSSSAH